MKPVHAQRTTSLLALAQKSDGEDRLGALSEGHTAALKLLLGDGSSFATEEKAQQQAALQAELVAVASTSAGGGLALDDVLDFLLSPAGAGVRNKLTALLAPEVEVSDFLFDDDTGPKSHWESAPRDEFEAGLRQRIDGAFQFGRIDPMVVAKAAVDVLAGSTGKDGRIDNSKLSKKTSSHLMLRIEEATQKKAVKNPTPGQKLLGLDDKTIVRIGKGVDLQPIVDRMGGFHAVADAVIGDHQPLKGAKVVAIQHFLPTFAGVLQQLERAGVAKADMHLIGKSYSTVDEMYAWLLANGYDAHPDSVGGNAASVEAHLKAAAKETLQQLFAGIDPKTSTERFVLADDGGKLLLALHQYFPEYAPLCCGFEQTARGIQVLEQMQKDGIPILCPIVNMAHSALKAKSEIPLIGENIVFDALQYLDDMKLKHPKTATVMGYGPVGQETVRALKARGIDVVVYDPSPERQAEMVAHGLTVVSREVALAHGDLVVGCTGRGSLTLDDMAGLKNGAILANGASGNHEFQMQAFGEGARMIKEMAFEGRGFDVHHDRHSALFHGQRVELGSGDLGASSLHRVLYDSRNGGKEIMVLRSGHVVNLGKDLPPEFIQTTRALVLTSMLQAARLTKPGIVDVDDALQDLIEHEVEKDISAQGLSFADPRFADLQPWNL